MNYLVIVQLKYATIEKACKSQAEALQYIKSFDGPVIGYAINPIKG